MKLKRLEYRALWILLTLQTFKGERPCEGELLMHRNISTELQSDVLIPCNFNTTLLGLDKSADIAVIWRQVNTTAHGLVEVMLRGEVKFWDSKNNRIKVFPKLSESGNFSIVLQKVQPYDLSLYRCELFNGTCRTEYQDIQLGLENNASSFALWITLGAFAVGIVVLVVYTTCLLHVKRRQNIITIETHYAENVVGAHANTGSKSMENPVYDTFHWPETEAEGLSSDMPVYATVTKGKM